MENGQLSIITYTESSFKDNVQTLISTFKSHFASAGINLDVQICSYQPDQDEFGRIHRGKFLLDSVISYVLFSKTHQSFKKKALSLFYSSGEWSKLLFRGSSNLGVRETPEYMRRDQFLTDKHLRAIFSFLESEKIFLIIASDDVIRKQDSINELVEESIEILKIHENKPVYIELAEYFEASSLMHQFGLKIYDVPPKLSNWQRFDFFCNTGACYIINRHFAKQIASTITLKPWLRVCSIDWLLTYISRVPNHLGPVYYFSRKKPLLENYSLESGNSDLVNE